MIRIYTLSTVASDTIFIAFTAMTLPTVSSAPDIIADVPAPNSPLIAPNIAPDSKPLANPSKTTFLLSLMLLLNFYYKAMRSASLINFLVLISVVIIWIHYQFIFLHIFSFFAKKLTRL